MVDRAQANGTNNILRRGSDGIALGWPAFGGVVVVFYLMVAKPSW